MDMNALHEIDQPSKQSEAHTGAYQNSPEPLLGVALAQDNTLDRKEKPVIDGDTLPL